MSSSRGMPSIVAEIELVEAELAAGQRQDDAILGHLLGKLGVVVAARLGAVAAADQEEVANLPCFTASMTLPATPRTALRAKPTVIVFSVVSAVKPGAARAAAITGEKSRSGPIC